MTLRRRAWQLRRGILGLAVDVDRRAQLASERLLVLPARDADGVKAHFRGVLYARWPRPPSPSTATTSPGRAAIAQRVERGEAGAHQGAASTGGSSAGIRATALAGAIMYSPYPPS